MRFNQVLHLFALGILLLFLTACSSSDDSDGSTIEAGFSITLDGTEYVLTNTVAGKIEGNLIVRGDNEAGDGSIQILFNSNGDLSEVRSTGFGSASSFPSASSFYYYNSFYMNFSLVSIDESANTVSFQFNGDIYDNQFDLTSDSFSIMGSFNGTYEEADPEISGIGISASLNGTNWIAVDDYQNGGFFPGSDVSHNFFSDDPYTISIITNHDTTTTGTYSFTNTETVNLVRVSRWDTNTNLLVDLAVTGTLVITEKVVGASQTTLSGTFEVAANEPEGEAVTITGGDYFYVYNNY